MAIEGVTLVDVLKLVVVPLLGTLGGWFAGFIRVRDRFFSNENRLTNLEAASERRSAALEKALGELKIELSEMKKKMEFDARASISSYASAAVMAELQKEQEDRWREVNRTLGKIEGILQASV